MSSDFAKVETALSARIAALDGSAYDQTPIRGIYRESSIPLSAIDDASSLGHLLYNVWVASAVNSNQARDGWRDDVDGTVYFSARVIVEVCFHLRPGRATEDGRLAADMARDVLRAILAAWTPAEVASYGPVIMRAVNGMQPNLTADYEWMLIRQEYLADFDLDLIP